MLTEEPISAAATLGAGLVLMLASTIDRFESLKGLGIEAKTRQLDDKIDQADKLLAHIQGLAELTSGALVRLNAGMGRLGAPSVRDSHALTNSIRSALAGVGTERVEIHRILRPWATTQAFDLAGRLLHPLHQHLLDVRHQLGRDADRIEREHGHDSAEFLAAHQNRLDMDQFYLRFNNTHEWALEDFVPRLKAMMDDAPFVSDEVRTPLLKSVESWRPELEYLIAHKEFRSPERWYDELKEIR